MERTGFKREPAMPAVEVPEGYTLIVEGPARVRVASGSVEVFGAELSSNSEVSVEPFRALPFYARELSRLEVEQGKFWFVRGSTVPSSWVKAAEDIASTKPRRVVVVGDIDSGKTAFTTLLLNTLVGDGVRVAVVDADVGQKSIGPPASLGMGLARSQVASLCDVPFEDGFFIGSFTPAGLIHRSVVGSLLLAQRAERGGAETVLVDTAGWVREWGGRELKLAETLALQPDYVVFVGERGEVSQVLRPISGFFSTLLVEPAQVLRQRSREERREYRRHLYRRWFAGASEVVLQLERTPVAYTALFNGVALSREEVERAEELLGVRISYAERTDNTLVIFSEEQPRATDLAKSVFSVSEVRVLTGVELLYNVVALASREKLLEGLGIVTGFNSSKGELRVYTAARQKEGMVLMLGNYKLNPATFDEIIIEKNPVLI
jgi:polynucleotide 5'-hydroxyl-kinase GRC3/NOL9